MVARADFCPRGARRLRGILVGRHSAPMVRSCSAHALQVARVENRKGAHEEKRLSLLKTRATARAGGHARASTAACCPPTPVRGRPHRPRPAESARGRAGGRQPRGECVGVSSTASSTRHATGRAFAREEPRWVLRGRGSREGCALLPLDVRASRDRAGDARVPGAREAHRIPARGER